MPVLDLINEETKPLYRMLGRVKLGRIVANKSGNGEHPEATPFFVLDQAPDIADILGKDPKHLHIVLPFPNKDDVLDVWHRLYGRKTGLKCRGDGRYIDWCADPETGEILVADGAALTAFKDGGQQFQTGDRVPCPGLKHGAYPKCKDCRIVAYLKFMVSGVNRLGFYQISTGSPLNIRRINTALDWIFELFPFLNSLEGTEFLLSMEPQEMSIRIDDKPVKKQVYLLQMEAHPDWVARLMARQRAYRLEAIDNTPVALLPGATNDTATPVHIVEALVDDEDIYDVEAGLLDDEAIIEDAVLIHDDRPPKTNGNGNKNGSAPATPNPETAASVPTSKVRPPLAPTPDWVIRVRDYINKQHDGSDPANNEQIKASLEQWRSSFGEEDTEAFCQFVFRCSTNELTKAMLHWMDSTYNDTAKRAELRTRIQSAAQLELGLK